MKVCLWDGHPWYSLARVNKSRWIIYNIIVSLINTKYLRSGHGTKIEGSDCKTGT